MSSAGQQFVADHIPSERIATSERTSSSAAFSADTVVDTVTAPLVTGRTYRLTWDGALSKGSGGANSDGYARCRIRAGSDTSGTQLQLRQRDQVVPADQAFPIRMEVEFTAASTANQTFVVTVVRQAGTSGDITAFAAADAPSYFYVDYIRG